ncbi:tetraspanin-4 isoform 5-T8 [Megaptera novaeangliae]
MRRSSTDESTYRRSPSPPGKEPGFARGGPFFGLHANPGPKAAQARYTSPKGNKYVVFYLDLSFIFLLELKRCSMARGCLQGVKYLMFAFNLLFWLGGCGILGVGIWLAATQGNFATLSSSFPSLSAANLLIVAGTFVMAIGFVGCIGAIKENKCLLLTFFVLLLLVFLLETSLAILFFAYTDKKTLQAHLGGSPPQPWNRPFLQGAWFLYWRTSALRNQDLGALGWQHGAVWVVTDRQVCTAGPEEGPAPVWHPGQRGPHQRLEHHPDRLPLLRGLQLHGLVRGLQRHARARLLLPGVQRELRAACTRHLVEGAVLRDSEGVAPGEPAGRGRLWAVHSTGSDLGPDLRHDDVLPGGEG